MKIRKRFAVPCAVLALTAMSSMASYAATGWVQENDSWVYYNSGNEKATDTFKKSGNNFYYLDSNGDMVFSSIVEYNDNYFYVNSSGAMVTSEWRTIENENGGSDDEPSEWWYYFQSNGKAVKKADNSDSLKFVSINTSTGSSKYTFDEEGHMLYGWLSSSGEILSDDDAWKNGMYYCGNSNDGSMTTGWKYLEAVNDEDQNREEDSYWFWFGNNGKKVTDKETKKINGRKYTFDENGVAKFDWYNNPAKLSTVSSASSYRYYNAEDQCWLSSGWFKAVPDEAADSEGYDDGNEVWYYAKSNGDLTCSEIKSINGQSYGFDQYGKMLHGLYAITFESNSKTISSAEKLENTEDLPETSADDVFVYYFGDSPKEGAMKTGTATLDIDGEKYIYEFKKSGSKKGSGTDGISNDYIYIEGRRLKAEEGSKYQVVTYNDTDYLISTNGKLAKSKTNIKDSDDMYYKTDKNGVVLKVSSEKITD